MTSFKTDIYRLFDGSGPGVMWFYDPDGEGWVVCDLDDPSCHSVKAMFRVNVKSGSDMEDKIHRRGGVLGQVGETCLIEWDKFIRFARDFPGDFDPESIASFERGGKRVVGSAIAEVVNQLAGSLSKIKSEYDKE